MGLTRSQRTEEHPLTDQPAGGSAEFDSPMSERMQALLSRAAEDQVTEQRQTQAVLTEIRAMLGRLPGEITAAATARQPDQVVSAQIAQLAERISQVGQRLDAVAQQVGQRLDGVAQQVAAKPAEDSGSLAVVGAVQTSTDNLLARIQALGARLDEFAARPPAPSGGQALAEISGRVGGLERNMAELGAAVSEIHRRVTGMDSAIGPMPAEVRGLGERLESRIGARLDRLDEVVAAVAAPSTGPDGDAIDDQLKEIRASLESLLDRPTLAEDRETVVLAVRQFLGETVSTTVSDSERSVREHLDASLPTAFGDSEDRLREQLDGLEEIVRNSAAELDERLQSVVSEQVDKTVAESERRVLEHLDEAIYALAEILIRRRSRPPRPAQPAPPPPPPPPVSAPTAVAPPPPAATAAAPPAPAKAEAPIESEAPAADAPEADAAPAPPPGASNLLPDRSAADEASDPPSADGEAAEGGDGQEQARRRRGWWRSGE